MTKTFGRRVAVDRLDLAVPEDRILADGHANGVGDAESGDFEALTPSELPGYEFLERIGGGASGSVYRSRQLSLDRDVAIKVLPMRGGDPKRLARQRQEAEILAHLRHPNVVHVYEVVHHNGCLRTRFSVRCETDLAEIGRQVTAHRNGPAPRQGFW